MRKATRVRGWMAVLLALWGLLLVAPAQALDIFATGDWSSLSIGAGDLVAGAGSDLTGSYASGSSATVLDLTGATGFTDAWRVDVRRSDATWDDNVTLSVQRTSDGTGIGSIADGLSYQPVEALDTDFFSGTGDRSGIEIQYRLEGVSIQVAPTTYSTSVIFTVVDQ